MFADCVSISTFAFVVVIPVGIASSAVGLTVWVKTAAIQRYNSIIKTKKKEHEEIVVFKI